MRINHNIMALNAWRNTQINQGALAKSLERLSSGLRINRAADDAAGLAISEKMRAQIGGLRTAQRNAQDAVSLIQTAEGALVEVHSILQRMRELAVQSASDTLQNTDRAQLQEEFKELQAEIDRIADTTEFNGQNLLDGNFNGTFLVGANASQTITASIATMSASALGVNPNAASIGTRTAASSAISALDSAIDDISTQRAKLGAKQNRLEHTIQSLGVAAENLTAAESRIRDADMALEMSQFTRSQILQQASTAMLAQANLVPQSVLALIGG